MIKRAALFEQLCDRGLKRAQRQKEDREINKIVEFNY